MIISKKELKLLLVITGSLLVLKLPELILRMVTVSFWVTNWMGKSASASSIGIIGGSDGPTSIFIAGKLGRTPDWLYFLCALAEIILYGILFFKGLKALKHGEH